MQRRLFIAGLTAAVLSPKVEMKWLNMSPAPVLPGNDLSNLPMVISGSFWVEGEMNKYYRNALIRKWTNNEKKQADR